jgi:chromosome segregation protein
LRIRRIELHGFKSFVDRTEFQFGPGISGVVGPNGCGKSNVIDAIRWTLGEQSAGNLRGQQMLDVIFAGSEGRRPASVAEVSVAFDNADGAFGGRYARFDEIEVGRRLFRDGRSDYLINKTTCRRKDVVGLFLDTGVGARAYSIIEQGRVDFAINAKPEERRVLVDEVAGINRFKTQRTEAERRMERTRENLIRVADLLREMARQRRSLQAQAARARRYRELRAAWRSAGLRALAGAGLRDKQAWDEARDGLDALKVAEAVARRELDAATGAAAGLREASSQARKAHEELRDRRAQALSKRQLRAKELQLRGEELRNVEQRLQRAAGEAEELERRRKSLTGEAAKAHQELSTARGTLQQVEAKLTEAARAETETRQAAREARAMVEGTKARLVEAMTESGRSRNLATLLERQVGEAEQRLSSQGERIEQAGRDGEVAVAAVAEAEAALAEAGALRASLAGSIAALDSEVSAASGTHRSAREASRTLRVRRDGARARLESLQELIQGLEGFGEGARELMTALRASGDAMGAVADLVRAPAELEGLVELALGERLQGLVVDDVDRFADRLEGLAGGRVLLVPAGAPDEAPQAGSLAERVESDERAPGLVDRLLGAAFEGPAAGTVRDRSGLWAGGEAGPGGLLAQRRTARELQASLTGLEAELEALEAKQAEAKAKVEALQHRRAGMASRAHEAELAELTRRRDLDEARARQKRTLRAADQAEAERVRLQADLATRREELQGVRARIATQDERRQVEERGLKALREAAEQAEQQAERRATATTTLRVELASAQQAAAGHQRDSRRIDSQVDDVERRVARVGSDTGAAKARHGQLEQLISRLAGEEQELEALHISLGKEVSAAAAVREEKAGAWQRAEEAVRTHQTELDRLRRKVATREVARAEARAALQACRARAAEDFDLELDPVLDVLAQKGRAEVELKGRLRVALVADEVTGEAAIVANQAEAGRATAKLDALGPVNLAADEEFAEVDRRHGELKGQQTDLEKALADLRKAIARIEKETKERFELAFHQVTERFSVLYPRLVGGGRAELQLTDPSDLLGTGIDIVVEPPGKRLQNLTLLSGGEKAMAAIALVFAIFQVKPSPFCLLDEVDAPLDDANSRRFNSMLREMSAETQFVVITHNRTTMEVADVLYGVTMQKPGVSSVVSVRMDEGPATDRA